MLQAERARPRRLGRYPGRSAFMAASRSILPGSAAMQGASPMRLLRTWGGLVGSEVKVTLEIEANIPSGAPENVVRTVTENSRTLKFKDHGFEEE